MVIDHPAIDRARPPVARSMECVPRVEAVMPPFLIQCGVRQNLGYSNIITGIVAEGLTG